MMQNNAFFDCFKWLPAYCMQGYVGHGPTIAVLRLVIGNWLMVISC